MTKTLKNMIIDILVTDTGQKELNKNSYRDKRGNIVHRNPSMAQALAIAALDQKENVRLMNQHNSEAMLPRFKRPKGKVQRNHPQEEYDFLKRKK